MKLIITIPILEEIAGVIEAREAGWTDAEIIEMLQEEYGFIDTAIYELVEDS